MTIAEKARAIREALGCTQEAIAERGGLERAEVNKVETGRNEATTWRIRRGLARAYGVTVETLSDCFDGILSVEELVRQAREGNGLAKSSPALLRDRKEWAEVVAQARIGLKMTDPEIPETVWGKVAEMYDSPSIPRPLTPRVVLHLVRAVAN